MSMSGVDNWMEKTPGILQAEEAGRQALRLYCAGRGKQARLCDITGIDKAAMSRMISGKDGYMIGLEVAIILEVATAGALRAEVLCPSRAHLLCDLMERRGVTGCA